MDWCGDELELYDGSGIDFLSFSVGIICGLHCLCGAFFFFYDLYQEFLSEYIGINDFETNRVVRTVE